MACIPTDKLDELAAGRLSEDSVEACMSHIAGCPKCASVLDECRANLNIAQDLEPLFTNLSSLPSGRIRSSFMMHSDTGTVGDSPAQPTLSETLDVPGYTIHRELQRGGQGVIYQAVQEATKRKVAIKFLLQGALAGKRARSRFQREVTLAAKLKHPNIVTVHDSGIAHDQCYYVMDYIRGLPLDEYVRFKALDIRSTLRLFHTVCEAVTHAHRHGVIHRDLKPSNILVSDEGTPFLLDFGLAKTQGQFSGGVSINSESGSLLGTLAYMAPEQTGGNPELIDTRTDVYALGLILYELLTEQPAYETRVKLETALRNIRQADPIRPSRLKRGLDADLDAIVMKALEKEPARRFQSASELAGDVLAWLEGRPIMARSASSLYLLRKLVGRHYFHTAVMLSLIASIIGFGAISYYQGLKAKEALARQSISEASARMAYKDMARFFDEAREGLRRKLAGWVLSEWDQGSRSMAREIFRELGPEDSPERSALQYLLEGDVTEEQLRSRLVPQHAALLHYVLAQRCLERGELEQARVEFQLCAESPESRYEWVRKSAKEYLAKLDGRQSSSLPADAASQATDGAR